MSVTCCPLSSGDGYPDFTFTTWRKARKVHECCECGNDIQVSTRYEFTSGAWDGNMSTYKTCSVCVELRKHFGCEGWVYEQLWTDLEENFIPYMKAGGPCMEGLSPLARKALFDSFADWLLDDPSDWQLKERPWYAEQFRRAEAIRARMEASK